ncbi:MAG: radical SAM protein, partial [Candidatus Bathyarchaeia archaeon]
LLEQCFKKPFAELKPLFNKAFKLSRTRFSDVIFFYVPGMVHFDAPFYRATDPNRFPGVSITGESCFLNCEHCRGRILRTMVSATTPQRLFKVCAKIKNMGGKGCLISGGAMKDGSVPLIDFIPTIRRIKQDLKLDLVVHTGIVYPELAEALASTNIDAALVDIVGSNETIKKIYHTDLTVHAFERSLTLLERNGIPVVPHIVVGIHYGKLKGERRALQIVSRHHPAALIVVGFMPLSQTPMEHVTPPSPMDVARVILAARFMLPKTPLILGCARPGEYKSDADVLAIKAGVSGIAYPSEEGYNFARKAELEVRFSTECCALHYKDLINHSNREKGC